MTIETFIPGKEATLESTISWNFPGDMPDYPYSDCNFSTTTAKDYACECEKTWGKDIYVADLTVQGGYICRSW